jgi:hypothetical protein
VVAAQALDQHLLGLSWDKGFASIETAEYEVIDAVLARAEADALVSA